MDGPGGVQSLRCQWWWSRSVTSAGPAVAMGQEGKRGPGEVAIVLPARSQRCEELLEGREGALG